MPKSPRSAIVRTVNTVQDRESRTAYQRLRSSVADTFINLMASLGVAGMDKRTAQKFALDLLNPAELQMAYRGDWVSRKIIDAPADDSTRMWRIWQADDDLVEALEAAERTYLLQQKITRALKLGRLYGGSALVLGIDQGLPNDPVELDKLVAGSLKYVHCVSRYELATGPIIPDPSSPWYGEPEYYQRTSSDPVAGGGMHRIHPSRVVRFIGNEPPTDVLQWDGGWGDSVLQSVYEACKDVGLVSATLANIVSDMKLDIYGIPGMTENMMDAEYKERLTTRVSYSNHMKSVVNAILKDKEETHERIQTNLTGTDDLLLAFLLIASAAADIPATRMLGQSPTGMSATGESDTRNYYDRIASDQVNRLQPGLVRLDEVLIRSVTGERDPSLYYTWGSLWQMSEKERAEIAKSRADTFKLDVDSGMFDDDVMRTARKNQLIEDGTYPGFEAAWEEWETAQAEAGAAAKQDIQGTAFNGAQIQAIAGVLEQVANKEMPPETAKQLIMIGFPGVEETEVDAMLTPLEKFEPPQPAIPPQLKGFTGLPVQPSGGDDPRGVGAGPPPRPGQPGSRPGGRGQVPPQLRQAANDEERLNRLRDKLAQRAADMKPMPLYVRRDVVNTDAIISWAREQGFTSIMKAEELHVTLCYSRTPVDWLKVGQDWTNDHAGADDNGGFRIVPGGPRVVERLGKAVVLSFASTKLSWRHESMCHRGASYDYEQYTPHITITYNPPDDLNLNEVEPYRGEIVLGPEIFEAITDTLDLTAELEVLYAANDEAQQHTFVTYDGNVSVQLDDNQRTYSDARMVFADEALEDVRVEVIGDLMFMHLPVELARDTAHAYELHATVDGTPMRLAHGTIVWKHVQADE